MSPHCWDSVSAAVALMSGSLLGQCSSSSSHVRIIVGTVYQQEQLLWPDHCWDSVSAATALMYGSLLGQCISSSSSSHVQIIVGAVYQQQLSCPDHCWDSVEQQQQLSCPDHCWDSVAAAALMSVSLLGQCSSSSSSHVRIIVGTV